MTVWFSGLRISGAISMTSNWAACPQALVANTIAARNSQPANAIATVRCSEGKGQMRTTAKVRPLGDEADRETSLCTVERIREEEASFQHTSLLSQYPSYFRSVNF